MEFKEVKQLVSGTKVNFKRDGLICGTAFYTGVILRPASDENHFTEIKYTGENYGFCNVDYKDIISIIQ